MKSISSFYIRIFDLKQNEGKKFTLLFFHSFFLGLFIALYFVPANAVFIKNYGIEQLPIAYIISGIAGWILSTIYSFLQKKVSGKILFLVALLFMLIITIISRVSLDYVDPKILSFFVFIWAWPFISLVGIEAGGLSLRFLNLIQVKRLFGLMNMGGVIASILGYFAIPLIMPLLSHSYDLLFIAVLFLLLSIINLFVLYKRVPEINYKDEDEEEDEDENGDKKIKKGKKVKTDNNTKGFKGLIKQKFLLLIFVSAVLSMTVIYIIDFGFLVSIKVQNELFKTPEQISQFLALVYGGLKIGELIISYFSSRLLSKYGVKLGLTILPLMSACIILISAGIGLIFGVATIAFLILMTLNKSQERILRRGLDDPAFNILYQPLPNDQKFNVQARVGSVMQLSISIAGILLFIVNKLLSIGNEYNLEYFPLFFLPILIGWVYISRKLYNSYKGKIRQVLAELSKTLKRDTSKKLYGSEILAKKFKDPNSKIVNLSVTILSETNPRIIEPYAAQLLERNDDAIKKAILRNIDPTWRRRLSQSIEKIINNEEHNDIKELAFLAKTSLDYSNITRKEPEIINNSNENLSKTDKLDIIKYLFKNKNEKAEKIILNLLKDDDRVIKNSAIKLAGKNKSEILINELIKLLKSQKYCHVSINTLIELGAKILLPLDQNFINKTNPTVLLRIVEIYAKVGSIQARSLLVSHINYPNRDIQQAVIRALYFCRYQAKDNEYSIIKAKLAETVENILWIYASIIDIENERNTLKLYQALDIEKDNNFETLFKLLSFLYEPRIITLIRKNIIGKNTIYALEIIDNFISQDIKQMIAPLFDDISVNNKLKTLHNIFPQHKLTFLNRLKTIITRDYNKIDTWTVTKSIEIIGKIYKKKRSRKAGQGDTRVHTDIEIWTKDEINKTLNKIRRSEMPDEIFLCLYHSDELIYTSAAKIIFEENQIRCIDYLSHMSKNKQELINDLKNFGFLLGDRVRLLKRHFLFFNVPENNLVNLAKIIRVKELKINDEFFFYESEKKDDIVIVLKGELSYYDNDTLLDVFAKNDIITRSFNIPSSVSSLKVTKNSTLLLVNRFEYFNLLVDDTGITQHILSEL